MSEKIDKNESPQESPLGIPVTPQHFLQILEILKAREVSKKPDLRIDGIHLFTGEGDIRRISKEGCSFWQFRIHAPKSSFVIDFTDPASLERLNGLFLAPRYAYLLPRECTEESLEEIRNWVKKEVKVKEYDCHGLRISGRCV